jgi:hypothetical protein
MKRLVAIIFIVVVLLIVGAAPVLANGNGPPKEILNYTWISGEVIESQSSDNAPPEDIQIYLPVQVIGRNPKRQCVHIVPRFQPAG